MESNKQEYTNVTGTALAIWLMLPLAAFLMAWFCVWAVSALDKLWGYTGGPIYFALAIALLFIATFIIQEKGIATMGDPV